MANHNNTTTNQESRAAKERRDRISISLFNEFECLRLGDHDKEREKFTLEIIETTQISKESFQELNQNKT